MAIRSARVLVVEDYEHMREILVDVLEEAGYAVEAAASGEKALALAQASLPDVVLLDLNLPLMDGRALRCALAKLPGGESVSLILITADQDAAQEAEQVGAQGWLTKPFDIDELLEMVARAAPPAGSTGT